MREALSLAKAELRRADHLLYVSLKYTRTVDVIRSVIERLISTFDLGIEALLRNAKEGKKLAEIPTLPRLRVQELQRIYADDAVLQQYIRFYQLLKSISKAKFEKSQEYRRHVTMITMLEKPIDITIDIVVDYYQKTREFVQYLEQLLK